MKMVHRYTVVGPQVFPAQHPPLPASDDAPSSDEGAVPEELQPQDPTVPPTSAGVPMPVPPGVACALAAPVALSSAAAPFEPSACLPPPPSRAVARRVELSAAEVASRFLTLYCSSPCHRTASNHSIPIRTPVVWCLRKWFETVCLGFGRSMVFWRAGRRPALHIVGKPSAQSPNIGHSKNVP